VNNEELRHQIVGLSRKRGSRYSGNIGFATYNSLQATLSRRLSHGLYLQAAYTFSKTIDNVSGSQSTDELNATKAGQNGANIFNAQDNVQQNKARGDFDRPHRLVVSYVYDLPVAANGFMHNEFFRGWSISGIVTYQSGLPFSVTDSTSGTAFGGGVGTGVLVCRPLFNPAAGANNSGNQLPASSGLPGCVPGTPTTVEQALLTGTPQHLVSLGHYLNPNFISLSSVVPNGTSGANGYGNVPRNAFRSPFQQNWDFSVMKSFHFKEGHEFQFRTDIFNVWNHPVFGTPASVALATPGTFAQITSTVVPARLIQFGLTYRH